MDTNNFSQVFTIGDIHGCKDLVKQMHTKIIETSKNIEGQKLLIYLGDYIDRGPDIKGTVQTLIDFKPDNFKQVFLLGNHEQMLLDYWNKKSKFDLINLKSNGFWASKNPLDRSKKLTMVEYLSKLPTEIVLEKFRLVHAGYRDFPYSSSLDEQSDDD